MPHLPSCSNSYYSNSSDWGDYMEDTETQFYEPTQPTYAGTIKDQRDTNDDIFNWSHTVSFSSSTASRKSFAFDADLNTDSHRKWTCKDLDQWTANDIMDWIICIAGNHKYEYEKINMPNFNIDGIKLSNMSESEFISRAPEFGKTLYLSLQEVINRYGYETPHLPAFNPSFRQEGGKSCLLPSGPCEDASTLTELNVFTASQSSRLESNGEDSDSNSIAVPPKPLKRLPGRPRGTRLKKKPGKIYSIAVPPKPLKRLPGRPRGTRLKKKPEKKCGRLWEFIRDLLLNPKHCPSVICWDDHSNGVFRFVHSEQAAKLWGDIKENPKMNYEKLSRAMRYYYKSKVLQPVLGRRLVYKFGPTATGWRTPNPNFRRND